MPTHAEVAPAGASALPLSDAPVFEAHGLTKVHTMGEVEVCALAATDLDFRRGALVLILGPSGSGKSTLLNILGGLDLPTSGHVVLWDHDLSAADERELTRFRREHVGFVFQFFNLLPSLTALENVRLVTEIARDSMDAVVDGVRVEAAGEGAS